MLLAFPDDPENLGLAQHVTWVAIATDGTGEANPYGSPERGREAGWFADMPGHWDELTGTEILTAVLDERITHGDSDDGLALSRYPELLESTYGAYYKVARLFAYAIGRPRLISRLVQFGMQSQTLAGRHQPNHPTGGSRLRVRA